MPTRRLLALAALAATVAVVRPVHAEPLERVAPARVCMVNNSVFPKDQIPIAVEGRTYFGCCEMCKGRLAQDPAVRSATDPVSGKSVDKATAVIGATPEGKVFYFESEKTFAAYQKRSAS